MKRLSFLVLTGLFFTFTACKEKTVEESNDTTTATEENVEAEVVEVVEEEKEEIVELTKKSILESITGFYDLAAVSANMGANSTEDII